MEKLRTNNYLDAFTDELQSAGRLTFSLKELNGHFPKHSANALKLSLTRLSKAGRIRSVHKGFYVIIPPEYRSRKSIPPELFVDRLFKHLDRNYYFALLTAANYHGATHQQIMESYVCIEKPAMRKSNGQPFRINYIVKSDFPKYGIIQKKTETGYINISGAELTALDLIKFQKNAGGINRAIGLIMEMKENIHPKNFEDVLTNIFPVSTLQRAGYIFDVILQLPDIANCIEEKLKSVTHYPIPLEISEPHNHCTRDAKWKIIENCAIELEPA